MKKFIKSFLFFTLGVLVCSCSSDVIDFSNPSKFRLSNYALDFSNAEGIAVSDGVATRAGVSGNLYVYDKYHQLQPINLRVSDEFKLHPDSVYPDNRIGLMAEVQSQFKVGDFYVFNGFFRFYDTETTQFNKGTMNWKTQPYDANTLMVNSKTGTIYDPRRTFDLVGGDCSTSGNMYFIEYTGYKNNTLLRITLEDRGLRIDNLLPDNENADIAHVDKHDNVLYRLDRIRLANGRILPLTDTQTAFVAADGEIYALKRDLETYETYEVLKLVNGQMSRVSAPAYDDFMRDFAGNLNGAEVVENIDKINRGTKTFLFGDRISVFDTSDYSLRKVDNLDCSPGSVFRVATEKYYFIFSNRDYHLYRFDFATEKLEQLNDEYQFYDLLPYGDDQAQFHGMRYSDGHEVYGHIDQNGDIKIIDENGNFKSVVIQPL